MNDLIQLITIPGTEKIVSEELLLKFPSSEILSVKKGLITFTNKENENNINLQQYKTLHTPLRIEYRDEEINLFRRDWKKEHVPAGTNPALAYIMCKMADIKSTDIVLDPFCGAGTIIITASVYFTPKRVIGFDISSNAIKKAITNCKAGNIAKNCYTLLNIPINKIRLAHNSIDKIICNMPFGIRSSEHDKNILTYKNFTKLAYKVLKEKGRMVILTIEKKLLTECMINTQFSTVGRLDIDQHGLYSSIFVYTKNS